ncbi:MAG: hypothetical protein PHW55_11810 [Methanothrix sp.]|jgi:hypothetical protein|nr:hypothetical protein [Candidatus Cloacimonadota bacterium]MDD5769255.1 hypothetical protein [Methanothrix sp.]
MRRFYFRFPESDELIGVTAKNYSQALRAAMAQVYGEERRNERAPNGTYASSICADRKTRNVFSRRKERTHADMGGDAA